MLQTDIGNRPQLVHRQPYITKPSGWVRLAIRLRLTKGNKSLIDAVENTYRWISQNYRQGDHVTLVVISRSEMDTDPHLNAVAILVKYLYKYTHTLNVSKVQAENEGDVPPGRIPIYSIAVQGMLSIP
ncbi:unnamed protein product [Rhizoctonia solani]|uniref:Uncharacterized protein n=1 Tax=Rhizoctonia solani TaxID=456999 RepID=A0A8H3CC30_9AGAM|nr:unnamed protein product [Rhizoctonia solani]